MTVLLTIGNKPNHRPSSQLRLQYWNITTMRPSKLHVVCLTSSYYIKLKFPIDIIHVPDACKAYTNTFFLPARNNLSKEIGSRRPENQPSNFNLDYTDVSDFTLIRDINIPPLMLYNILLPINHYIGSIAIKAMTKTMNNIGIPHGYFIRSLGHWISP